MSHSFGVVVFALLHVLAGWVVGRVHSYRRGHREGFAMAKRLYGFDADGAILTRPGEDLIGTVRSARGEAALADGGKAK